MNSEHLQAALAITGFSAAQVSLVALIFCLTVAFKRIQLIEEMVGPSGSAINTQKQVWGGGPVGRFMRISYLLNFFFWRQFPGHGKKVASQLGNISVEVPWRLRAWLIVPMGVFGLAMLLVFVCGYFVV